MPEKSDLGNRMKNNYEFRTRNFLPRRTYSITRLDGKSFHSYTKHLNRPFDKDFMKVMELTIKSLCAEIQGVEFAYTQSDEISLLLCDFATIKTEAWFDGNVQKMVSVSASIATAYFNRFAENYLPESISAKLAMFDSRVFTIPDPIEVENYFIWRQRDCVRNSINSVGQAYFSPKQLNKLNTDQVQEKLFQEKGINWADFSYFEKNGIFIINEQIQKEDSIRNEWKVKAMDFIKDREEFNKMIPRME